MQYTYCPISKTRKTRRQWKLVSYKNIIWETFFFKNHTKNVVEKLFLDPFLENQNRAYLGINALKILRGLFLFYAKLRVIKICWNKAANPLFLPHIKHFEKSSGKRVLELVSLLHCLQDFWRKYFSCYILLTG